MLRHWALGRLREPLTVADLAGRVHRSPRTFARWFAARTGSCPAGTHARHVSPGLGGHLKFGMNALALPGV
jgi:AraC-like DNA-binding protein